MCSTRNPGCSRPFWASRTPRPIGAPDAPAGYEPKAGTFRHPLHPLVSVIPALLDYAVAGRPARSAVDPPRRAARGAFARRAHRRPQSPRGRQRPHSSGRRIAFARIEVLLPGTNRGRPGAMCGACGLAQVGEDARDRSAVRYSFAYFFFLPSRRSSGARPHPRFRFSFRPPVRIREQRQLRYLVHSVM